MPDYTRLATAIIAVIVVLLGGVGVLTDMVSFQDWLIAVSLGGGLLGVGYGIDSKSKP